MVYFCSLMSGAGFQPVPLLDYHLGHLHVTSACGLPTWANWGFLTAWWAGFKSKCPKRVRRMCMDGIRMI